MRNRKVCRLLLALDKKQQKRFDLFLSSPYFNTKDELVSLYHVILEWLKKGQNDTEEAVFMLWKEDEPFNQNAFRKNCSELVTLFYAFLTHEGAAKNERLKYLCLLEELFLLEGAPEWDRVYQKAKKYFANQGQYQKYSSFYLILIEYLFLQYNYVEKREDSLESLISIKSHAKELNFEFCIDISTLDDALRKIFSREESIECAEEVMEELSASWESFPPSLQMAYFSYLVEKNWKQEDYEILFAILKEHIGKMDIEFAQGVLQVCINYNIRNMKGRMNKYASQYIEVVSLGSRSAKLFTPKSCKGSLFINNVTIATRGGYDAWLEELYNDWLPSVLPGEREKCEAYINGFRAFYKTDYKEALKQFHLFQKLNEDSLQEMRIRSAILACYYEIDEDFVDSKIDADERFYYRQKGVDERFSGYGKRFIRYVKQIRKASPNDKVKLLDLKQAIIKEPSMLAAWLMCKCDNKAGIRIELFSEYEKQLAYEPH